MAERVPFDVTAYERRTRTGECFICGFLGGEPDLKHELLYDDGAHVAFLNRYPTLRGYALVAPRRHVEDVVRDFTPDEYLALQAVCIGWPEQSTTSLRPSEPMCCHWAACRATRTFIGTSHRCHREFPTSSSSFTH